ncbi:MAG: glutamate formimidoyltransferase [Planctomycetota bacterium]
MTKLLEFVPNFSEGRDAAVVDAIVADMQSAPGSMVLAREMDKDHHRCVITLAGPVEAMIEAAVRGAQSAVERIDLRKHQGEHKRMGAMDVAPFVPLGESTMADAVAAAKVAGARIAEEAGVPVFLYAEAAQRDSRRKLGDFRNKQFEGLQRLVGTDPEFAPDFGPAKLHASAGATAVGARKFLIAYNVNLQTPDVQVAKDIAKAVREKDGGLPKVQGMGFWLDDLKLAQVSMNLLDFETTSIRRVFDEVARLAKERGVAVAHSELVGLAPAAALDDATAKHVQLKGWDPELMIVERRLAGGA